MVVRNGRFHKKQTVIFRLVKWHTKTLYSFGWLLFRTDGPDLSGLELRGNLMEVPVCGFITSCPDYAAESFVVNAFDYLVKPIRRDRFAHTISRIETFFYLTRRAQLFDPAATRYYFDGLKYAEATGDNYLIGLCLDNVSELLPCNQDNSPDMSDSQLIALYTEDAAISGKSGLGLHLIRDLARAIACQISVQSKPGVGTEFRLAFL